MKKFLLVIAVFTGFQTAEVSAQRLTVLHTNDTHSHMDPERDGRGGVIERAVFIDSVRTADGRRNVLLLDAGDWDQGSSYFTILNGDLEVEVLNAMGYDALVLGNHEFDNGIDELARRVKAIKGDVLCCNYDFSEFKLGKYVKPYAVYRRGGYKIGVVGLLCNVGSVVAADISEKLVFQDPVEAAGKWATYLKEKKHCDLVIVLSHMGYKEDCVFVSKSRNIDLVVGGHSHTDLRGPTMVNDLDGNPVPVVQDYRWGTYVGRISIR